jgi:anti-sigma factor RsiW
MAIDDGDTSYFTCREMVELVTAYLEGALPPSDRARFEAHLAACPGCAGYLAQMRETIDRLGRLRDDDIPREAREELRALYRRITGGGT